MPEGPDGKTIIIVKKVSGHGGHHGGAWKVAYADFVTAMMALFMVLWLVNTASVTTREKIASFFRRPGVFEKGSGTPLELGGSGILSEAFAPPAEGNSRITASDKSYNVPTAGGEYIEGFGRGEGERAGDQGMGVSKGLSLDDIAANIKVNLKKAAEEDVRYAKGGWGEDYFGKGLGDGDQLGNSDVPAVGETPGGEGAGSQSDGSGGVLSGTGEGAGGEGEGAAAGGAIGENPLGEIDVFIDQRGLHIEIMDTPETSMFQLGSASIKGDAKKALKRIASLIAKVPNQIDIEGHTDARPFSSSMRKRYDNWNLSSDRAHAARRVLQEMGVPSSKISRVVGYADQRPKVEDAMDPSNRRITITMRYSDDAANILTGQASTVNPVREQKEAEGGEVVESTAGDEEAKPVQEEEVLSKTKEENLGVEVGTHLPEGERIDPAELFPPKKPQKKDKIFGPGGTIFGD